MIDLIQLKDPLVSFETGIVLFIFAYFMNSGLMVRNGFTNLISSSLTIIGMIMVLYGVLALYKRKGLIK
ncbi:MAG: hypothetical protein KKB31_02435 [Nanoarchaeota archaeon]|nr:hypothetical protein [Nanoarchaeota archaeon]